VSERASAALARRIEDLEARVARIENERHPSLEDAVPPLSPEVSGALEEVSASGPLALAGRTLIALGGAYLLRAATAVAWLPAVAGTVLGLLYAAAWTLEADRAARRGQGISASIAAATGALLAYPLLWEASTRFGTIPARAALACAFAFVLMAGAVAARRSRPAFAWFHLASAIVLALGLLLHGHDVVAALAALAALHAAAETASARFGWHGMRWATGAAAGLLAAGVLAAASPEAHVAAVGVLAAGVFAAALVRTVRRAPDAFDVAAGTSSLVIACLAVAALPPGLRRWPAVAALVVAAAAYRAAAAGAEGSRRHALAAAATALGLAGTAALLSGDARAIAWAGTGLLAAWRSRRDVHLRASAAAYSVAALGAGGALACAISGIAGIGGARHLTPAGAIAASAAVAITLLAAGRGTRAGRIADGVLGGLGFAAIATSAWPSDAIAGAAGTATLAAAAAALTLAAGAGRPPLRHLAWVLLAAGGARLLLVDLRDGRPLTLFISLVSYGGALLAAQASRARKPVDP
jgi:hypothetical protein